jgi:phosphotriesterase-related protein
MSASEEGYVMTTGGPLAPGELGLTSCHEHILMNMAAWPAEEDDDALAFARLPVSIETIGALRRDSWTLNYDNYTLDEIDVAVNELAAFHAAGGRTIVDLTTQGLEPRPEEVRDIAARAGVNVVLGCGYYIASMHPRFVKELDIPALAAAMVDEIQHGVAGSHVRPGIIGELGTSEQIEPAEAKVLAAAARASHETGLAINVHTYPWGTNGIDAARLLIEEGVAPDRIVISHLDNAPIDLDYHLALGDLGVWLEYDGFGKEWYVDSKCSWFPRDYERIAALRHLIDAGHLHRIVIGCDVCLKMQLTRYGGWGYVHLAKTVPRLMRALGIDEAEVETLLVENPASLLTIRN